jgi:hypothetical protein
LSFGAQTPEPIDNLYLITPYRILQFAVLNEEHLFALLSSIVAEAEAEPIRVQAERLAQMQLGHIADLRLQRRRAFQAEVMTAVGRVGLERRPLDLDAFTSAHTTMCGVLAALVEEVRQRWSAEFSQAAQATLERIRNELGENGPKAAKSAVAPLLEGVTNPFEALKMLLREFEAAFDLLLDMAENSPSEEAVGASQAAANTFVRYLALVREQLGFLNQRQVGTG